MVADKGFTYGEIVFESIAEIIIYIRKTYGVFQEENSGTFIDLGHGTGKGILTACLTHKFERCVGVELLDWLYKKSETLKKNYEAYASNDFFTSHPKFDIHQADIFDFNWSNFDLLLIPLTCFEDKCIAKISELCKNLKKGTWIITLSKPILDPDSLFESKFVVRR